MSNKEDKFGHWPAILTSVFLSALFVAVYGGSNWLAGLRDDAETWYYAWERVIPFVSWMIIPYMSIDLFFVAAPFFCGSREELRTLARRITFGILVAGAFFLLVPLHLAVPRPQPTNWTAPLYAFLQGFDQPFNLFPSLHITLRTILGAHYVRHSRGTWRIATHIWFSLIGVSTLLTYQHHIIDVLGGFVLAAICFHLFREDALLEETTINPKVGALYGTSALVLILIALAFGAAALLLLWPALGLGLASAAYLGYAPSVYRKSKGRVPLATRLVFYPVQAGQWLSLRYYRQQSDPWNKVTREVWLGAHLDVREAEEARRQGITAVLDLTAEFSENAVFLNMPYLNLPILDLTAPSQKQLHAAANFIEKHVECGKVYVHCKAGYSRSAAAVAAYLLSSGKARDLHECILMLRGARPAIVIRPEIRKALKTFASTLRVETVAS